MKTVFAGDAAVSTFPPRAIDGTDNNLSHPEWGSVGEQLLRVAPAEYSDGTSSPAGIDRPSARALSNALAKHTATATPNDRHLTAFVYIWGQFLDHDIDLTKAASPAESLPIDVPSGDESFDPDGSGGDVIPFTRSIYDPTTGTSTDNPRQQINQITAWIDGSMIYGSDNERAAALRAFDRGRMKVTETSVGDLPPLNNDGLPVANDAHRVADDQLYLAGDIRANENIELTSMHTLFLREHNRLADEIGANNPGLSDEEIYQRARAQVIAEIQVITYREWLPALLGTNALSAYRGYDPTVNPNIANEFSTAAFRLHSSINDDVEFFDNEGRPIPFTYIDEHGHEVTVDGEISLSEAFFNPTLFGQTGVDGILKYAASTHAEEIDTQVVSSLRDFLFGLPGQGGLDLAALNIQRGRDHGLADYNQTRVSYGLDPITSFADITSDASLQQALQEMYGSVHDIDLWVGALAEDHVRGSSTGELTRTILADQFERLRDGDRFWYSRIFSPRDVSRLERTTLADIIERNTNVNGLQRNVFVFRPEVRGTVFIDINANGQPSPREVGLANVELQLLNDVGEVIGTTTTNQRGQYRFDSFIETGDYRIRLVSKSPLATTTPVERDILISSGDTRIANVNFGLRPPVVSWRPGVRDPFRRR